MLSCLLYPGKKMKWRFVAGLQFLLLFSPAVFAQDRNPDGFPVLSYKNPGVQAFNNLLISAQKKREKWAYDPLAVAMRFHKVSDVRFVHINRKSDRAECPLNSVVTIGEEGFHDDRMRGRWTQFYLERRECMKPGRIKEVRESFLCGMAGFQDVFLKDLCSKENATPIIDVSVEMTPETADVPCDGFPYTFNVKFIITAHGPGKITFRRIRSDGATAPPEEIVFREGGKKEFEDYYRVGKPGDYWFRVEVLTPRRISGQDSSKITCHDFDQQRQKIPCPSHRVMVVP